jgi:NADPH:quinone reductase-like Zn-dependent oxidoreductase
MVAGGHIDPVRPNEYPLEDAARALEALLGRRVVGKVVLVP